MTGTAHTPPCSSLRWLFGLLVLLGTLAGISARLWVPRLSALEATVAKQSTHTAVVETELRHIRELLDEMRPYVIPGPKRPLGLRLDGPPEWLHPAVLDGSDRQPAAAVADTREHAQ